MSRTGHVVVTVRPTRIFWPQHCWSVLEAGMCIRRLPPDEKRMCFFNKVRDGLKECGDLAVNSLTRRSP